jgi:ring-1,2-phenylacetyl-CoA epoxidase subunit PaaC
MPIRLGDGTPESRKRLSNALETLWRFTGELFEAGPGEQELIASQAVIETSALTAPWRETVERVFLEATLPMPTGEWMQSGGLVGRHSEHLGHILAELQYLQRTIPGAVW